MMKGKAGDTEGYEAGSDRLPLEARRRFAVKEESDFISPLREGKDGMRRDSWHRFPRGGKDRPPVERL